MTGGTPRAEYDAIGIRGLREETGQRTSHLLAGMRLPAPELDPDRREQPGRARLSCTDRAGTDAYIADVKVSERWTYAYVGTVFCTHLEATAYQRR